jgi:hypothetical protein
VLVLDGVLDLAASTLVTEPKWVRLLKREHEKLYKKDFMFLMKKQRRSEGDMK